MENILKFITNVENLLIMKEIKLDEITAESMRGLIKTDSRESKELNRILNEILVEDRNGKTQLYLYDYSISTNIKQELKSRGFTVETGGRYNEINTYISW